MYALCKILNCVSLQDSFMAHLLILRYPARMYPVISTSRKSFSHPVPGVPVLGLENIYVLFFFYLYLRKYEYFDGMCSSLDHLINIRRCESLNQVLGFAFHVKRYLQVNEIMCFWNAVVLCYFLKRFKLGLR